MSITGIDICITVPYAIAIKHRNLTLATNFPAMIVEWYHHRNNSIVYFVIDTCFHVYSSLDYEIALTDLVCYRF